ncbi:MAG: alpha-L-fucosidase [Phycisphaerales bacterium]|nr:alpha-L-fucosidase [Phycisphaerales bacterium]
MFAQRAFAAAVVAGSILGASPATGQSAGSGPASPDDARMEWWRDARFGMFIHWGLYSVPAGEWNGQTNHAEWIRTTAQIPIGTYEKFVDQFNPVNFDADAWAQMAADAGMKYVVITTKHHDGFCLFDSKSTDFDIMSTPFKRDIMKELSEACARHGLKMCWYHSIMDWHHPDYLPRRGWEAAARPEGDADMDRYTKYLFSEVTELLTNYGDIGVMWFDGEWESTWNHERGEALYKLCRSLQPNVIVNNRVDKGRGGMGGMSDDGYFGDYGTPEQEIPATGIPGVDWETCMTMNNNWGYNSHDKNFKSSEDLIRKLCDIASKGGNFLLNIGPKADGTFPQESIDRLHDIGNWMHVNGQSIYGTTASPFDDITWGRCTVRAGDKASTLYLQVFDWPKSGVLTLGGLGSDITAARLLGDEGRAVGVEQRDGTAYLQVGTNRPDPICSVVAVQIAGRPVVYKAPTIEAVSTILVGPVQASITPGSAGLETRYTLDGSAPTATSPLAKGPIAIKDSCTLSAQSFHGGKAVSAVVQQQFEKVTPAGGVAHWGSATGLKVEEYAGDWRAMPDFSKLTPGAPTTATGRALAPGYGKEHVALRYSGYLRVPEDGVYVFALTSDDGSMLKIGDQTVVDNDGLHSTETKTGVAALAAGWHPITVEWFNNTGGAELGLKMAPVGGAPAPIDTGAFRHD